MPHSLSLTLDDTRTLEVVILSSNSTGFPAYAYVEDDHGNRLATSETTTFNGYCAHEIAAILGSQIAEYSFVPDDFAICDCESD